MSHKLQVRNKLDITLIQMDPIHLKGQREIIIRLQMLMILMITFYRLIKEDKID